MEKRICQHWHGFKAMGDFFKNVLSRLKGTFGSEWLRIKKNQWTGIQFTHLKGFNIIVALHFILNLMCNFSL